MGLSLPPRRLQIVNRLVDRHPYIVSLLFPVVLWSIITGLFFLIELGLRVLHLPSLHADHLSSLQLNLIGELALALALAWLISWLGWWRETGFASRITGKGIVLCIIPFILISLPLFTALAAGSLKTSSSTIITVVVTCLLIGFVEEGCFRGIIVRILLPRGILICVLFSSIFFGLFHFINILSGLPWLYVAGQAILGLGMGILFAALRLRTSSIWPLILLHALRDISGLILLSINPHKALTASLASIIALSIFSLLFILNAAVLLRSSQLRKLRIKYGLAPAPALEAYPEPITGDTLKGEQL